MPDMAALRAEELASRLRRAGAGFIDVVEQIDERLWRLSPAPAVWSISKEAEHVADAALLHQWIVRLTTGEKVSSRGPAIERTRIATPTGSRSKRSFVPWAMPERRNRW
jgi:phage gp46-like protein